LRFVGRLNNNSSHEVALITSHAVQMKHVLQILFELTSNPPCQKNGTSVNGSGDNKQTGTQA
jgi:hypothetical protein